MIEIWGNESKIGDYPNEDFVGRYGRYEGDIVCSS